MTNFSESARRPSALFVPGAALCSATTAGMLAALEQSGQWKSLDIIFASSAGAFSAAYLLGGGAVRGAAGYWRAMPEFLAKGPFISWRRALLGRPMLDIQLIIEDIFSDTNPIPWAKVISSSYNKQAQFLIQVMDACAGRPVFLCGFKTVEALKAAISGACWIPLFAGVSPYEIRKALLSQMYVLDHKLNIIHPNKLLVFDGSICDFHMLKVKEATNLSLSIHLDPLHPSLLQTLDTPFGQKLTWLEALAARLIFRKYPTSVAVYIEQVLGGGRFRQSEQLLQESQRNPFAVTIIQPAEAVLIDNSTRDPQTFRRAVLSGWRGAKAKLKLLDLEVPHEWRK